MNLKIELRTIYGRKIFYPGCEKSKKLLLLTKQKSFTEKDIKTLKSLGYVIENITKQDEI